MQTFIWLGIALIIGIIAFLLFQNYQHPPMAREALVVKKSSTKSKCKVIFELTSTGRQVEFIISPKQSELIQEGDRGMLFSRGQKYKGFDRM